jgi:hypothetical protein
LSALAGLLVAEGVIDASAVVDGELVLRDASSRNRNAIVSQRSGPGVFVKREEEPGREAAVYRRLAGVPGLRRFVPALKRWDAERALLFLGVEAGAADLWAHHFDIARFPAEIGREIGRALGILHRGTRLPSPRHAPDHAPFVLRIHRPRVGALAELAPASIDLVKLIQRHDSIGERLDEFRSRWCESALTHNDVKWPNILVVPPAESGPSSIRLVDWEHAVEGDPAWDVGSALAAYVTFWLHSIPPAPSATDPDGLAAEARFPVHAMRPAIRALWEGYLDAAAVRAAVADELLRRAVALCAARLIATAFEETETRATVSARALLHLQVASNVLDDPAMAARRLLGLGAGDGPAAG